MALPLRFPRFYIELPPLTVAYKRGREHLARRHFVTICYTVNAATHCYLLSMEFSGGQLDHMHTGKRTKPQCHGCLMSWGLHRT